MEWPHPHAHVAEDRSMTQRVTHWQITTLLASLSSNDNVAMIADGDTPHFGTTTNMNPDPHSLRLSGVCGIEGENQSEYWETCANNFRENMSSCAVVVKKHTQCQL